LHTVNENTFTLIYGKMMVAHKISFRN